MATNPTNLVSKPRFWKKKAVLIKPEATYGKDAVPDGMVNWIEARNISLTGYEAETADRNIVMPYMGNGGKIIISRWSKLSFDIALVGSGVAGTAPRWGALMLGALFAQTVTAATSTVFNLVSDDPGSLTAYINIDGTLHAFIGSRGNVKGKIGAKGLPMLSFEFSSLYTAPVVGVMPTIDRAGWAVEEGVNAVNTGHVTVGGVDLAFSELTWDCGNKVTRLDLPGQREVMLSDRAASADLTVVAPALSVFNPYTLADQAIVMDISNVHGTVAGKKIKTVLKSKIVGVAEVEIEGMAAYKLTLSPEPVDGNDEIVLTCL